MATGVKKVPNRRRRKIHRELSDQAVPGRHTQIWGVFRLSFAKKNLAGLKIPVFLLGCFEGFGGPDRLLSHYTSAPSQVAQCVKSLSSTMAEGPTNRLYVGNIPWSTTVDELRGIFSGCGTITLVDIPTGRQGRSRGYGIVEYSNVNEAQVAIQTLDGA